MNKDLNELFEIKNSNEGDKAKTSANFIKHVGMRILILILGVSVFLLLMQLPSMSMNNGVGLLYMSIFFPILWLIYLFFETIYFLHKKEYSLRNANLITFFVAGIIYCLLMSLLM